MTTYSYSRLTTYENCALRYKYRYIDGIKKDAVGIEAYLGNTVHLTLQKLYQDLMREKTNSLGDLITFFNELWSKNWTPNIFLVNKKYTEDNYRRTGERCLRDYYKRYAPFGQSTTLGLEERIQIDLGQGHYRMVGYIDRLARAPDGTLEIHDYKTSGRLPDQETINADRQLALYQIAIQQRWPDTRKVKLIWHFLLFDMELASTRDARQLAGLSQDLIRLIQEVEQAKTFAPRESPLCDWCEYAPDCPIQKHRFKVDGLPVNRYLTEEGVVLVNKYMQILTERRARGKEYDDELEKVRAAILSFAEREGTQVLKGLDYKLRIDTESRLVLPDMADPKRAELEALLNKAGKWEEVAALSPSRLQEALQKTSWDPALAQRIKGLCSEACFPRLYPSKIKDAERLFEALTEE
ncbi:MAG: PD-(D/E)XK nuclease family protein [Candidatus Omnitrophica bacterium]|nr:PD-(D/E)XK nuclease family protein [Candidatus Omnitrophota bacterium]